MADKITPDDATLLKKINTAFAAANEAEKIAATAQTELVSRSRVVGALLLEAKKRHPPVGEFEAFLKRVDGMKLSRAYDYMRIAGGRITDEQLRQEARERQRKSRVKKRIPKPQPQPEPKPVSVTDPPVTETPKLIPSLNRTTQSSEISIEQRRAENELSDRKAEDKSVHYLAEFTVACRTYLPKITVEADRQKARDLVAELLSKKAEAA
jgi:hypothetical protein